MPIATEHIGPAPLSASAEQHMVPMRDGVELATDVYLPASPGRCPTVLIRLPYDKNGRYCFMEQTAAEFTARGYATVVQDVRGKFRSQGETVPFVHEAEDGYDTIEGINRQQWSDAVVGMCGDSYFGFTQWAAVTTAHPALKAIVPRVTSMELAVAVPHREPERIVTLYAAEYLADYWASRDIVHTPIDHDRRPLLEAFEEAFTASRSRSAAFDSYVPHPQPAEPFPHGHPSQAAPVPTLHGVGWFDNLLGESMDDYTAMATHPAWGPVTYLYADSINHENHRLARSPVQPENDHSTDDKALRRTIAHDVAPVLEFFDVFLKGERPEESLPGCAGTWVTWASVPPRTGRRRKPVSSCCTSPNPTWQYGTRTAARCTRARRPLPIHRTRCDGHTTRTTWCPASPGIPFRRCANGSTRAGSIPVPTC